MKRVENRLRALEQRGRPVDSALEPEAAARRARLADRAAWFLAAPPAVADYFATIILSCGPWADQSVDAIRTIVSARTKETHPLFWAVTDIVEFAYAWHGGISLRDVQVRLIDRARYRLEGHIALYECDHHIGPASRERTYARIFGADYDREALSAGVGGIPTALLPLWRASGAHDAKTLAVMGIGEAELALLAVDDAAPEGRTP